jgi:GNAT superfamily N-acetyltransferase
MADSIEIEPMNRPGRFLDLQRGFYRGDPQYVPPLTLGERWQVDPTKNPFFRHGEAEFLVARRAGRVAGRISASRDQLHDELHGDRVGFFGYFEAEDGEVARALVDRAAAWLHHRGATELRGPVDLSTNYRCGLLIDGEPGPPVFQMNYNPPVYAGYLESCGLVKARDLLALYAWTADIDLGRFKRLGDRVLRRTGAILRPIRLGSDLPTLWQLYNAIWEKNWGFAPMSEGEFLHHAKDMKAIARSQLLQIAEVDGRPVAFAVSLPDVNMAIRACNGRLVPLGWWKFLRALKRVNRARTLILGVIPEYRKSGLDAALILRVTEEAARIGIIESEAGWILDDNLAMRRPLESIGFRPYRRYRIYTKPLI